MTPLVRWSLGGRYPCPPKTKRGTMLNAAAPTSDFLMNSPTGYREASKRAKKIQKSPLNTFKGDFSFCRVRRNSPKFDKKNPQKNPRYLACPPYICYLALLFNGLKSEDYE